MNIITEVNIVLKPSKLYTCTTLESLRVSADKRSSETANNLRWPEETFRWIFLDTWDTVPKDGKFATAQH